MFSIHYTDNTRRVCAFAHMHICKLNRRPFIGAACLTHNIARYTRPIRLPVHSRVGMKKRGCKRCNKRPRFLDTLNS